MKKLSLVLPFAALASCLGAGCGNGSAADDQADADPAAPDAGIDGADSASDAGGGGPDADASPGQCTALDGDVWASPNGSGTVCTFENPCSLASARDAARSLTGSMTQDLVVALRGGTYRLTETFTLGPDDSGQNGYDVVYRACPGEKPVLSGGVEVTGWSVYDPGKNIHRASLPSSVSTRQLFVNGERARRARSGYDPSGFQIIAQGYQAPDTTMASWTNIGDIELVDFNQWKSFRCGVASIVGTTITMDQPCWSLAQWHTGYGMEQPTWIENAYELLDEPGEWYHDRAAGFVYYIPRGGENLASGEVVVGALEALVALTGTLDDPVHDLRFEGLVFSHDTWLRPSSTAGYPVLQAGQLLTGDPSSPSLEKTPGSVTLRCAKRVRLEGNNFTHLGTTALVLEYGSQDNEVVGNAFRDVSGGAIFAGDVNQPNPADDREVVRDNTIANNAISDSGREYFDCPGILLGYTDGTTVEHNELHHLPYTGISVGWGWSLAETVSGANRIVGNRVSYVMQRLIDGGMVYTLSSQPDSEIRDNYLFNQAHDYGGIYLDQGSQYFSITDNVVSSAPYWYLLQPNVAPRAQGNVVQGNFSDTDSALCCGTEGCCTDVNTVSDNTVFAPGQWPEAAKAIIDLAGLEPSYAHLRSAETRIEAEDYNHGENLEAYMDVTFWDNAGGAYRDDSVDLYWCTECSNDCMLSGTQTSEWITYNIYASAAGNYELVFTAATNDDTALIDVDVDGNGAGQVALPNTGSSSDFTASALAGVSLTQGPHLLKLTFTGSLSLDYFTYRKE